jgi:hypothetical protein
MTPSICTRQIFPFSGAIILTRWAKKQPYMNQNIFYHDLQAVAIGTDQIFFNSFPHTNGHVQGKVRPPIYAVKHKQKPFQLAISEPWGEIGP